MSLKMSFLRDAPFSRVSFGLVISWNPKQPFINGCLVKQPFSI